MVSFILATSLLLAAASPAAPPASDVKLVVVIAVDGVSWPRLVEARPALSRGLARLLDESTVYTTCRYGHLNTETSPGHAALSTGAPPRVTGVVGNRWFVRGADGATKVVTSIEQPGPAAVPGQPALFYREIARDGRLYVFANARELELWTKSGELGKAEAHVGAGPNGETVVFDSDDAHWHYALRHGQQPPALTPGPPIQGPGALRVATLGDRLVAEHPDSRVVSLSPKDRSAAFMAGRDPRHVVYWYEKGTGRLVSSAAYDTVGLLGSAGKAIVDRFNREQAGAMLPNRFGLIWKPVAESQPYAFDLSGYQIPALGLGPQHGLDAFPTGYFEALYESGLADEVVTDLVVKFIRDEAFGLGRRRTPDILNVSLAAHDIVAHSYGTESAEAADALVRVDTQIGRILHALDQSYTPGQVVVALSADHGFSPVPEALRRSGRAATGGRLVTSDRALPSFQERVSRLLAAELCLDPSGAYLLATDTSWNVAWSGPFPLRTVDGSCGDAGRAVDAAEFGRVAERIIERHFAEEVQDVLLVADEEAWPATEATEMARNVLDRDRIGDAILIPRPHALVHWDPARGSGHGSHHPYDTHVPLLMRGADFPRGERAEAVTPYDLAPTLAGVLGVSMPDAVGRDLRRPAAVSGDARTTARSRAR